MFSPHMFECLGTCITKTLLHYMRVRDEMVFQNVIVLQSAMFSSTAIVGNWQSPAAGNQPLPLCR